MTPATSRRTRVLQILVALAVIAGIFLLPWPAARGIGVLAACLLMHLFMGHGGHGGHHPPEPPSTPPR